MALLRLFGYEVYQLPACIPINGISLLQPGNSPIPFSLPPAILLTLLLALLFVLPLQDPGDLSADLSHLLGHSEGNGNLLPGPGRNLSASVDGNHLYLILADLGDLPDLSFSDEGGSWLGKADHKGLIQGSHRPPANHVIDIEPLLVRDHGEVLEIVLPGFLGPLQDGFIAQPHQPALLHLGYNSCHLLPG